jgi:hypothetical protein
MGEVEQEQRVALSSQSDDVFAKGLYLGWYRAPAQLSASRLPGGRPPLMLMADD